MSWDDLERYLYRTSYYPRFVLDSVPASQPYVGGHQLGAEVRLSSHPETGYHTCIAVDRCSIGYGTLTPGTWTRSHGSLTIALALDTSDEADNVQLHRLARGQILQLRIGLGDMTESQYAPVFSGVVRSLSRGPDGYWMLDMVDLLGGLTTRMTRKGSRASLFGALSTTTVSSSYTAGAATIVVTDGSGFEATTGLDYLIRVTPNTGNPFYLMATKSGSTFTITQRGIFDTVDANASAGNLVEEIAYNEDHPINLAAQVMCSTGTGGNGGADTMPERWGMGIPADLVDLQRMAQDQALLQSAQYMAHLRVGEEQTDGLSWLAEFLRPFGVFLAMWRGRVCARPVNVVSGNDTPRIEQSKILPSKDEVVIDTTHYYWDPDSPVEYATFRATFGTLTETASFTGDTVNEVTEDDIASRPSIEVLDWPCPDIWTETRDLCTTHDAQTNAWALDIVEQRLFRWVTRVPERVVVSVNGWDTAGCGIGDTILLISDKLRTRIGNPTHDFPGGRYGLIVGGGPDWFRGGCTWDLLFAAEVDET